MTDLSPDVQATLRAQAEHAVEIIRTWPEKMLPHLVAEVIDEAYALGVSSERARQQGLRTALHESVKLQSHYAELLNMHDGGARIAFKDVDEWLARLKELESTP
jgi:hypothetical protein